jgi:DNA-binding transcriptional MerR regulator
MRERQDTKLYYSISEASAIARVKPHVLRYWETQFKMLRPKKNKAGNRMYRRRDLKLIQMIKELLYDKGFTIAGARRKLLDERHAIKEQIELPLGDKSDRSMILKDAIRDLKDILRHLKGTVGDGVPTNGSGTADSIAAEELPGPEQEAIAAGFGEDDGMSGDIREASSMAEE